MDKMDSFPLKLAIRGVQGQKIDYYNTECYGKMQKRGPDPDYSALSLFSIQWS